MQNQALHATDAPARPGAGFVLLLAAVALAPLPFGADTAWAEEALAALTAGAFFLWTLELRRAGKPFPIALDYLRLPGLLYGAAILWACVQAQGKISVDPALTLQGILRLLCYGGAFLLSAQTGRSETHARRMLEVITFACAGYAIYGLYLHFTGSTRVLWEEKTHYQTLLTATFLSRNVCATYLGMGILAAMTLLAQGGLTRRSAFYLLAAGIEGAALVMTFSRSGIPSFVFGAVVWMILMGLAAKGKARMAFLGLVGMIAAAFIALGLVTSFNGSHWAPLERSISERHLRSESVVRAIADRPWRGWGLGTFEEAYKPYVPDALALFALQRHDRIDHAHNTYLQLAMELGIPAAALLMLAPFLLAARCVRGALRRRRFPMYPALGAAVSAQIAGHAFWDFSAEIPAVAFIYAAMLGVAWAQSFSSRRQMSGYAEENRL